MTSSRQVSWHTLLAAYRGRQSWKTCYQYLIPPLVVMSVEANPLPGYVVLAYRRSLRTRLAPARSPLSCTSYLKDMCVCRAPTWTVQRASCLAVQQARAHRGGAMRKMPETQGNQTPGHDLVHRKANTKARFLVPPWGTHTRPNSRHSGQGTPIRMPMATCRQQVGVRRSRKLPRATPRQPISS